MMISRELSTPDGQALQPNHRLTRTEINIRTPKSMRLAPTQPLQLQTLSPFYPLSPFWMFRWINKEHGFVLKANQACAINSMVERMWMAMHGPPEVRRSRQQRGSHSYTTPQIMICSPSTESRCSHAETHRSAAEVEVGARWEEEEKEAKPACCEQEEAAP